METIRTVCYPVPEINTGQASGIIVIAPECGKKTSIYGRDYYDKMATTPVQTHSLNVKVVNDIWERDFEDTDALVTFRPDVAIGVRTADCVPVLMSAEDVGGVAAVHAGWKGTLGGIVDNTLDVLVKKGADLSKLRVAFGPSISPGSYEVDRDLADRFVEAGFADYVSWPDGEEGKPHLDLQGVNVERLLRRGVQRQNIFPCNQCTFDQKDNDGNFIFPSYRRDKTTTRILTAITICGRSEMERVRRLIGLV